MRTLVAYESMFGNTHHVAEEIVRGLSVTCDTRLVAVTDVTDELIDWADFFIVGGPTHAHGLSSKQSRQGAVDLAAKASDRLHLDSSATGTGLRDWFKTCPHVNHKQAAAFDTRYDSSPILTGRASRGIAHRLFNHGFQLIAEPESFLIDKANVLLPGEEIRAMRWGISLANSLAVAH